ncbi:GNAT family N-acetyltransferase [Hamadaea sp. NPDC050747]|uniref:GNAT family N-acetyltransferase n=1 Tax=Hamadaea sp. NPDC050747 TaxID=3155789 RepID=UPI0034006646
MRVRDARPGDNAGLVSLAAQSTMDGDLALRFDREPDYFALNRLAGQEWRVGVVDGDSGPLGCIAVARRTAYLDGEPGSIAYVGDLKVHPDFRRRGVARALGQWAYQTALDLVGPTAPMISTILAGNDAATTLALGFVPGVTRWATIRSASVDLLTRHRPRRSDLAVRLAGPADEPEMVKLWHRLAVRRQFAPALDGFPLEQPGLDYLLARRPDGELAGFVGLWDQHEIKQMRVMGYSARLAAVRVAFNAAAPLFGAPRLPKPGGALAYRTAVNVCASDVETLQTLLRHGCDRLHGRYSFLTVGLDVGDPLARALTGLRAQPTDVDLLVLNGPRDRRTPIHFEIATV